MNEVMEGVLERVRAERRRQDEKWGEQSHPICKWMAILLEELGEVGKAYCEDRLSEIEAEVVQVAAVAVCWLEDIARQRAADGE